MTSTLPSTVTDQQLHYGLCVAGSVTAIAGQPPVDPLGQVGGFRRVGECPRLARYGSAASAKLRGTDLL